MGWPFTGTAHSMCARQYCSTMSVWSPLSMPHMPTINPTPSRLRYVWLITLVTSSQFSQQPCAMPWLVMPGPQARSTQYSRSRCTSTPPVSSSAQSGTCQRSSSPQRSSTMSASVRMRRSSHGSASQLFTKFCSSSGSSLSRRNSFTTCDHVTHGLYSAFIQKPSFSAPCLRPRTARHSPARSIPGLRVSGISAPHSGHMYTAAAARSSRLMPGSDGKRMLSNASSPYAPHSGHGTK